MNRIKPNFIGIGGQRCASTWLYDILADHPEVCLSLDKELDFFSNYWDRGYEWYEAHFAKPTPITKIGGEISPSYLHSSDAPSRLYKYNPHTKIIVSVRHPIDRAYSNHTHNVRLGFVHKRDLSFEAALQCNPTYIEHSLYCDPLRRWLDTFPRHQILILLFDDIEVDARQVARRVYEFLDIRSDHCSRALMTKSNESSAVASIRLALAIDRVRRFANRNGLMWIWQFMTLIGMRHLYRLINQRRVSDVLPKMRGDTRQSLAKLFRADTEALESLIDVRLDAWKS